ncbi:DUF4974 domain-containing protein [Fulvivirga sp. M361]|uniref:FecR family protein n=1 Tax=Fulvivirga sp. M361 TaxID=2594266 RepID=UPI001179CF88|nr:FecR family protein [Fulvivirga sp. M361]TRX61817.1 DUF4974 domain-containing protein [Fulvivirga sp. M361]
MRQEKLEKLIRKYLKGQASLEEQQKVDKWYTSFDDTEVLMVGDPDNKEEIRKKMFSNIQSGLVVQRLRDHYAARRKRRRFIGTSVAAVLLLVLVATGVISRYYMKQSHFSAAGIVYVDRHTEAGQKRTMTLPDGSRVRLNAGSEIRFPEKFSKESRNVFLKGEAFFEVTKNPSKPFIVTSGQFTTSVLGTSFNVKYYPEEDQMQVTVASGKVNVTHEDNAVILEKNQRVVFSSADSAWIKRVVTAQDYIAWKDGWLVFQNEPLDEVMPALERWYGVKIVTKSIHENPKINKFLKVGLLKRRVTLKQQNQSLSAVLKALGHAGNFTYEMRNDSVMITISPQKFYLNKDLVTN